jgi:hypothetical protein
MEIDAIYLSNLNIVSWFFNGKVSLMYINVGVRHCDTNMLLKVQKLADSNDLG